MYSPNIWKERHIRGNLLLPKCLLSVEVALLCDAGEREMVYAATQSTRDGKSGSQQALGSLSARCSFQTSPFFSRFGDQQLLNLEDWLGCNADGWWRAGSTGKVGIKIQSLRGCDILIWFQCWGEWFVSCLVGRGVTGVLVFTLT